MPTPTKGRRFGSDPAHERLILANLATSLFRHGRITTTQAKAKRLRPFAERLITKAKRGDLHSRRQVLSVVRDRDVSTTLFDEIGPQYSARPGGYTRIVKAAPRRGDAAPMAVIELVEPMTEPPASRKSDTAARRQAKQEDKVAALAGDTQEGTGAAPSGDTGDTGDATATGSAGAGEDAGAATSTPDESR